MRGASSTLSLSDAKLKSGLVKRINSTVFQDLNSFNLSAENKLGCYWDLISDRALSILHQHQEPISLMVMMQLSALILTITRLTNIKKEEDRLKIEKER